MGGMLAILNAGSRVDDVSEVMEVSSPGVCSVSISDSDATDVEFVGVMEQDDGGVFVLEDGEADSTIFGTSTVTGKAARVVVLRAGAYASSSITSGLNGQIPVRRKALWMVVGVNAFSRACA